MPLSPPRRCHHNGQSEPPRTILFRPMSLSELGGALGAGSALGVPRKKELRVGFSIMPAMFVGQPVRSTAAGRSPLGTPPNVREW